MSSEYGTRTLRLYAFGRSVFLSHQHGSTESFTRMRWTFTHSAGVGIFAGLYQ